MELFFPGTCASEKILLGLQTCELQASALQQAAKFIEKPGFSMITVSSWRAEPDE
jgi:hypothetical protein